MHEQLTHLKMSHELQVARGKRPKPSTTFRLRKNRKCNNKCKMFGRCRFQIFSKDFGGRCALANTDKISHYRKTRIAKTLFGSKKDMINVMKDVLSEMDLAIDHKDPAHLEKLINCYAKIIATEFGEKKNINVSTEQQPMSFAEGCNRMQLVEATINKKNENKVIEGEIE